MWRRLLVTVSVALLLMCCMSAFAVSFVAKTTSKITIYAKTDTSSKVIATAEKNADIVLYGTQDGWAKIKYNGKTGYTKASGVKKSSRTVYIKSRYTQLYSTYDKSSKKLDVIGYGTPVTLYGTYDGWAQIKYGNKTCYCVESALTDKNPNGDGTKVYLKKDSANFYAYPNTSADSKSIKSSATITYYCTYDNKWCRVKIGSTYGYIEKSLLSTTKVTTASVNAASPTSTASPASGQSVAMDWFKSNIANIFGRGDTAVVTDVKTGISWKVKRTGGLYHADAEPLTKSDTAAMKKACGSSFDTWNRRAIWVSIGGKKYAASMNCKPHGSCSISGNGFNGVFCIHFVNSKTHCSEKVDPDHQACIKAALKAG